MAKPAPLGALDIVAPPPDLASAVGGFVRRIDPECGGVVRILPDVRSSLQVQAADPYWIREHGPAESWRRVPRVSLWGPRHHWGWGYARRDISAFGVILTAAGLTALAPEPIASLVDQVRPVTDIDRSLADALDAAPDTPFDAWTARAIAALRAVLGDRLQAPDPLAPALAVLAAAEGDATARAAKACGLSERQFRRVFRLRHGASPKTYQRLMRVDRLLRDLHVRPWEGDPWAETPVAFADQAHAIREFRALTGLTPRLYAQAKAAGDATLRSVAQDSQAPPPPADGGA